MSRGAGAEVFTVGHCVRGHGTTAVMKVITICRQPRQDCCVAPRLRPRLTKRHPTRSCRSSRRGRRLVCGAGLLRGRSEVDYLPTGLVGAVRYTSANTTTFKRAPDDSDDSSSPVPVLSHSHPRRSTSHSRYVGRGRLRNRRRNQNRQPRVEARVGAPANATTCLSSRCSSRSSPRSSQDRTPA